MKLEMGCQRIFPLTFENRDPIPPVPSSTPYLSLELSFHVLAHHRQLLIYYS